MSKIIEKLILPRYSSLLQTTENQFGFKSNSSTDLCVFSLKQVIDYYRNNGSPVYLCFLDTSKAFDRVPHNILFSKLFERKVLHIVIRLLVYWYSTQTFTIRWNNVLSDHIAAIYIVVHLYLPIIKLFLISFQLHATKFLKV